MTNFYTFISGKHFNVTIKNMKNRKRKHLNRNSKNLLGILESFYVIYVKRILSKKFKEFLRHKFTEIALLIINVFTTYHFSPVRYNCQRSMTVPGIITGVLVEPRNATY